MCHSVFTDTGYFEKLNQGKFIYFISNLDFG